MSSGTKPSVDENDNIAPQKDLQGSRVPCRGGAGVLPPWAGTELPLCSPSPVSPGWVAKLLPHAWPGIRVTMVT